MIIAAIITFAALCFYSGYLLGFRLGWNAGTINLAEKLTDGGAK